MSAGADGLTRRALFGRAAALLAAASPLGAAAVSQQPREGDAGTLRDPTAAGRSRTVTTSSDNDEAIKRIEHQLRCTCGCNLDVFTCRTTDFTCTYSPELHREVVALYQDGRTAQEIIDAFVARYGERVLMAPKPVSFNLVGYLLPGAGILAVGAGLAWVIGRRRDLKVSGAGDSTADVRSSAHPLVRPSDEELDRLRRDLAEVED